jgi:hypothetical protein
LAPGRVDDDRRLLRHLLAALGYRTRKALQGAPDSFGSFQAGAGVRTPAELVRHMTSVLSYARTCFAGGAHLPPDALPSLADEIARLRGVLEDLSRYLGSGATTVNGVTLDRLLQGPFSDAMTHAGQLAMLRRLAGSPIPPEDFVTSPISADPFADR